MRISDWSSDVCSSDLGNDVNLRDFEGRSALLLGKAKDNNASCAIGPFVRLFDDGFGMDRSEEHTSELQSLMRISYAVFCLKKNNKPTTKARKSDSKTTRRQVFTRSEVTGLQVNRES